MGGNIDITNEGLQQIEAILIEYAHQGYPKIIRALREIVEDNRWQTWMPTDDAFLFAERAYAIHQNHLAVQYGVNRRSQLLRGNFRYWIFKHGNSLAPRPSHLAWDGVALPPDHPFWELHCAPCGWGCTCEIRGARNEAGIRRAKGDPDKKLPEGWDKPLPTTGRPLGIDWQFEGQRWPNIRQIIEAVLSGKHPYI